MESELVAGLTGPWPALSALLPAAGREGVLGLVAALLLGLRHATDPDHLTAVATLAVSPQSAGPRRAGALGLAWGVGHAATFLALGLVFLFSGVALPETARRAAEVAIGVVIAGLALRLLWRWKRGHFHVHPHEHDGREHSHPHLHEAATHHAPHAHDHTLERSPAAAFGVGLLHGAGGSAMVSVLLVASLAEFTWALAALSLFAAATIVAMTSVSAALGLALQQRPLARRLERLVPVFGAASLCFGCWYALGVS